MLNRKGKLTQVLLKASTLINHARQNNCQVILAGDLNSNSDETWEWCNENGLNMAVM